MGNKKLLELAAQAVGYKWKEIPLRAERGIDALWLIDEDGDVINTAWNPLEDDGQALRLVVALHMLVDPGCGGCHIRFDNRDNSHYVTELGDPSIATRRAIVLAAAEIAKSKTPSVI